MQRKVAKIDTVKFLNEIREPKVSELGGKGCSLAVLTNKGFRVPKGFVVNSRVFFEYLEQNTLTARIKRLACRINERNYQKMSKEIVNLISKGKMAKEVVLGIKKCLDDMNVQHVSIRSSAVSEDSPNATFAGLYDTFLNVKTESHYVLKNIQKVWASLFSERAIIYRIKKEISHLEGMSVLVQEMILAEISGITFTIHPMDKKKILIEASYGIGNMIVGGKVEPDSYLVTRNNLKIVKKRIGKKYKMSKAENKEIKIVNIKKDLVGEQVLSDSTIKNIAQVCLKIEGIFHCPQDIEWCVHNKNLWLLQSRPITGRYNR